MKSVIQILVLVTLAGLSISYPASLESDPELGDKFEGDIVLSTEQKINIQQRFSGQKGLNAERNGLLDVSSQWPEGKVYYKFHEPHFDAPHRNHVLRGMQLIEEVSCIRFYEADENTEAYINITAFPDGCYSNVGYLQEEQTVNFQTYDPDTGCYRLATIVHEFLHTLGFFHQQSASDRDDFVTIVFDNIQTGLEYNFEAYSPSVVTDFGIPYDYGSVMHYGPTAFSKNGQKTIIPHDPTAEIGQRQSISPKDIYKLNIMYKCPIPI